MNTSFLEVEELIWERISLIPDPEIPIISIVELGVVRTLQWDGKSLRIVITPTYTGCPAVHLFVAEIKAAMHEQGFDNLEIVTMYAPAWTTDWLAPEAKEKLRRYGIAPPVIRAVDDDPFSTPPIVPCPRCDAENTTLVSQFGATACKALYSCNVCKEPFEYFKHF
jgi:ring-1,2-phenylacetyl-CoA epoxidase subunit PaaD